MKLFKTWLREDARRTHRVLRVLRGYGPLLSLLAGHDLAAQDTTVIPIQQLEVTVTRIAEPLARVPAAVSVVTRQDVQRAQPGIGIEEALVHVPGLLVNNRYNFAQGTRISIRGFGARAAFGVRGIRVLTDGVPLTMPDGQANLNNVDLTSIGRIEVLRGAASMLYGNAAGGVVAFETESPPVGFNLQAKLLAGSFDMLRGNAKIGGGSERTRYLVNIARLTADGFRAHSQVEQQNLNARIRHELRDDSFVALTINAADAPTAYNPGSLPLDSARLRPEMAWPRNVATRSREAARQLQVALEHGRTMGTFRSNVVAYGITRSLENPLPFAYIQLDRKAGGVRSSVGGDMGRFALTGGLDVELQADERREFNNDNGEAGTERIRDQTDHIVNVGPFLRLSAQLTEALGVAGGVRYDRTHFDSNDRLLADGRDDSGERTMSALSPMAGLTYRLSADVTAFTSISTAFQTPTTTELINNPTSSGFNDLDPQRSVSYEVGLRAARGRGHAELSVYHTGVRDALVSYQIPGGDGRDFFRNAARTRQRGVEAAAALLLAPWWRVTTSYTWSDFIFVDDGVAESDFEGNRVPGVPPHHIAARSTWGTSAWHLELELEHTSSFFSADSNDEATRNPAATVVDVRGAGQLRTGATRWEPFVGINNLLDERYFGSVVVNAAGARYFEPAPTRNLYLGVGVAIGNWP
ncbi:MAG TPA: TonB-dependent receptor [Longimicrobiales bacterium]